MSAGAARRGIPFVVSAPSGTGKTTVCRAVLERDPRLRFSVSHTTRKPRADEVDGVDYYFVDTEEFRKLVDSGAFLEHAEYSGRLYGTSAAALDLVLGEGLDVLLEIEVQGARQLRESGFDARFVFLLPPSLETLEVRLRGRGTDPPEAIHRRLAVADRELEAVRFFDYAVVNDDLEAAIEAVRAIIGAERLGKTDAVRARFGREATLARWPDREIDRGAGKQR